RRERKKRIPRNASSVALSCPRPKLSYSTARKHTRLIVSSFELVRSLTFTTLCMSSTSFARRCEQMLIGMPLFRIQLC
ncbi:hypothetical protein KC19_8G061200, partial [Ceratodon purpureus]